LIVSALGARFWIRRQHKIAVRLYMGAKRDE